MDSRPGKLTLPDWKLLEVLDSIADTFKSGDRMGPRLECDNKSTFKSVGWMIKQ